MFASKKGIDYGVHAGEGSWVYLDTWNAINGGALAKAVRNMAANFNNEIGKVGQSIEDKTGDISSTLVNYLQAAISHEQSKERAYIEYLVKKVDLLISSLNLKKELFEKNNSLLSNYYGLQISELNNLIENCKNELKDINSLNIAKVLTNLINLSTDFENSLRIHKTKNKTISSEKIEARIIKNANETLKLFQGEEDKISSRKKELIKSFRKNKANEKKYQQILISILHDKLLQEIKGEEPSLKVIGLSIGMMISIIEENPVFKKFIIELQENFDEKTYQSIENMLDGVTFYTPENKLTFRDLMSASLDFSQNIIGQTSNIDMKKINKAIAARNELRKQNKKKGKLEKENIKIEDYLYTQKGNFKVNFFDKLGKSGFSSELQSCIKRGMANVGGTGKVNPKIDLFYITFSFNDSYLKRYAEAFTYTTKIKKGGYGNIIEKILTQNGEQKMPSTQYVDVDKMNETFSKLLEDINNFKSDITNSYFIENNSSKDYYMHDAKSSYVSLGRGGIKLGDMTMSDFIRKITTGGVPSSDLFYFVMINTHPDTVLGTTYKSDLEKYIMLIYNLLMFDTYDCEMAAKQLMNNFKDKQKSNVNFINLYKVGSAYYPLSLFLQAVLDYFNTIDIAYDPDKGIYNDMAAVNLIPYSGKLSYGKTLEDWELNKNTMEAKTQFKMHMILNYTAFLNNYFMIK